MKHSFHQYFKWLRNSLLSSYAIIDLNNSPTVEHLGCSPFGVIRENVAANIPPHACGMLPPPVKGSIGQDVMMGI